MPIRLFWPMNDMVERIRADEDLREFRVVASAASSEGQEFVNQLDEARGKVFVFDPLAVAMSAKRDTEGFAALIQDAASQ